MSEERKELSQAELPDYMGFIGLAGVVALGTATVARFADCRRRDQNTAWQSVLSKAFEESLTDITTAGIKLYRDFLDMLYESGWWAIPGLAPNVNLHMTIKALAEQNSGNTEQFKEELTSFLFRFFCDNKCARLDQLVKSWRDCTEIEPAWVVLRSALVAHKDGHYHLSVASLLPVIEHLVRTIAARKGNMNLVIEHGLTSDFLGSSVSMIRRIPQPFVTGF